MLKFGLPILCSTWVDFGLFGAFNDVVYLRLGILCVEVWKTVVA